MSKAWNLMPHIVWPPKRTYHPQPRIPAFAGNPGQGGQKELKKGPGSQAGDPEEGTICHTVHTALSYPSTIVKS